MPASSYSGKLSFDCLSMKNLQIIEGKNHYEVSEERF